MTLVVDASVAAKWLIHEPDSALAVRYLAEDLIAPTILRIECANALIRRLRLRQLSQEETGRRLRELLTLPVQLQTVDEDSAFRLALTLRHPVYDCLYLALAHARDVPLVTADRTFRDKAVAAGLGARIELMGEEAAPQT